MGNQQSMKNSRLQQQSGSNNQFKENKLKYSQKSAIQNSISKLSFKNEKENTKKIPLSTKYGKNGFNPHQLFYNSIQEYNKKFGHEQNIKMKKNEKSQMHFNLNEQIKKSNQNESTTYETKKLRKNSSYSQFSNKFEQKDIFSEQNSFNFQETKQKQLKNIDLLPLQSLLNKLKIPSATYTLKILIESYYEAYLMHHQKVIVSLSDCYVNELGELIVIYQSQQPTSSISTPPVLDYCFNFVTVIYKIFEIVQSLITDTQRYQDSENRQKIQFLYQNIVQIIHYCKKTDNKNTQKNVQNRIYRKVMNLLQNFIQQNNFKQNLIKQFISQGLKNSKYSSGSSQKMMRKNNQKSKNTKSSDYSQIQLEETRLLKQVLKMEFNKRSDIQIKKTNHLKTENYDDHQQNHHQNKEDQKRSLYKKKHTRNVTQNNVNRLSDIKNNNSNLYTQTNETFNMKNITERFQEVQSQYSYVNDMNKNTSENRNFKKTHKNDFSGRQFTQYDKSNRNNINYQYAINIYATASQNNFVKQNVQNNKNSYESKQNSKIRQKKVVGFKQVGQNTQTKNQNRRNVQQEPQNSRNVKHQTSIDRLPQNTDPYYTADCFKQNLNESGYRGKSTADNKMQRSRLQMMAREVQVRNGTQHNMAYTSSNTIGTSFKF